MKILVTAGSTRTMIDKVRCITNIFKGRTGHKIAEEFFNANHDVTLITSNKELKSYVNKVINYKSYDELYNAMEREITTGEYDVVIHSAAVSDYKVEGIYEDFGGMEYPMDLRKIRSSSKIGSTHDELYLELVPTEKIIDKIRSEWDFKGKLVKFKLQVDMSDDELLEIAEKSRLHSNADIIVANCLEWIHEHAYILHNHGCIDVKRNRLSEELLRLVE